MVTHQLVQAVCKAYWVKWRSLAEGTFIQCTYSIYTCCSSRRQALSEVLFMVVILWYSGIVFTKCFAKIYNLANLCMLWLQDYHTVLLVNVWFMLGVCVQCVSLEMYFYINEWKISFIKNSKICICSCIFIQQSFNHHKQLWQVCNLTNII